MNRNHDLKIFLYNLRIIILSEYLIFLRLYGKIISDYHIKTEEINLTYRIGRKDTVWVIQTLSQRLRI